MSRKRKMTIAHKGAAPDKLRSGASPGRRAPGKQGFEKVFERIYRLVLKIPKGRVMTYGQIARLLEGSYSPRLVGWAMHATPHDERNIPWHRVINSRGAISTDRVIPYAPGLQGSLLEAEGVVFDERGHCDLEVYQWSPRSARFKQIIASQTQSMRGKDAKGSKDARGSTKKPK
jgi:methylated-DNA-protein-cysteine methyltransferase related protein